MCGRAGSSRPSCPEAHSRALKDGRMPTEPDGSCCAAKFVVLPLSWIEGRSLRSVSVLVFMVGERKAGGSKGCLFGTVRWSASSSEAKSRAIRFLAVGYRPGRLVGRLTSSRQARSRAIHSARRSAGSKQAGSTATRSERRLASSRQARCVLRVRRRRGRGQFAQGSIALEVEVVGGGLAQHEVGGREKKLRSLRARARRDSWKEERKNDGLGTSIVCVCADAASECDSSFDLCCLCLT